MPDRRIDSQLPQYLHAADAQNDLLTQPHLTARHVQLARDRPVRRIVHHDVRIQQQYRHSPDLHVPHPNVYLPVRQRYLHQQLPAGLGLDQRYGQTGKIIRAVHMMLRSVHVDYLIEKARPVHEPDGDEGHSEMVHGFARVARQNAQPAAVEMQRLRKTVLAAKIGHGPAGIVRIRFVKPGLARRIHVVVEIPQNLQILAEKRVALKQRIPVIRVDVDQQLHRVPVMVPQFRMDVAEQSPRLRRPGPPQIVRQLLQPDKRFRYVEIR